MFCCYDERTVTKEMCSTKKKESRSEHLSYCDNIDYKHTEHNNQMLQIRPPSSILFLLIPTQGRGGWVLGKGANHYNTTVIV